MGFAGTPVLETMVSPLAKREASSGVLMLCILKIRFSLNHGHLSNPLPRRGMARRAGGMGTTMRGNGATTAQPPSACPS